jgi:uncharacterized membrane protein YkoI
MNSKRIFAGILSVAMLASMMAVQAFAAELTAMQAKTIAQKYLPKDSIHLHTKDEGYKYELKFFSESRQEKYEVQIDKFSQKLREFESKLVHDYGSQKVTLSEEDAKKAVTNELEGAEIVTVVLDNDDWYKEYKVTFQTATSYGEYEVHPETGTVLQREIKFVEQANTASTMLTMEQARQIALEKVPDAIIYKLKLDHEDGRMIYEGEMRKGMFEYEFEIDAATGAIIDWDVDYDD